MGLSGTTLPGAPFLLKLHFVFLLAPLATSHLKIYIRLVTNNQLTQSLLGYFSANTIKPTVFKLASGSLFICQTSQEQSLGYKQNSSPLKHLKLGHHDTHSS